MNTSIESKDFNGSVVNALPNTTLTFDTSLNISLETRHKVCYIQ